MTQDEKNLATLTHLSGIFIGIIGPLIFWLMKKDTSEILDDQGKEAINFHISYIVYFFVSIILTFIFIGVILFIILILAFVTLQIIAAVNVQKNIRHRYPLIFRILK